MDGVRGSIEVNFAVLGPLEVRRRGETVEVTGRRLRTLLCLLVLDAGRTVPTDRLIAGVWRDRPPAAVANALQALVSRLRTALGDQRGLVEATATGYRLAVGLDQVDAHRFARLAAEGRAALAAGSPAEAAVTLRAALELWRGSALADLDGDEIAASALARVEALRLAALEDRIEADLLLGREADLTAELPALIAAHPFHERLRGQFMRALYDSGRRAEALAAFEDARAVFAEELGADPSPELAGLHLSMLRGEPADERERTPVPAGSPVPAHGLVPVPAPAPGPAGSPRRGNLRARLTSFVGRERDVLRTAELLARHRLVTLLGPGGAGKSRLAVETAETVADGLADGVWLVELAPVADPAEVPQTVFSAFSALELRDGPLVRPGPFPPVGPRPALPPALGPGGEAAADRPGQLRAPGRGGGAARRPRARRLPRRAGPGHESRASRHHRRADLAGTAAGAPAAGQRSGRRPGRCRRAGLSGGPPVRRARRGGPPRLPARGGGRGGGADLP
ncbi:BTAD domain-containing putative transcriptional regulator [Planomonospora algeriensis]